MAGFDFADGTLVLTEAGSKRRASLHALRGIEALKALDPGGSTSSRGFGSVPPRAERRESHAQARAYRSPHHRRHRQRLLRRDPARRTAFADRANAAPDHAEWERLFEATRATLQTWIDRLRADAGDRFPEGVTAFRQGMAVHGRFGEPCPRCGAPVQRIRYADNETNYCARCQTEGKLLADRGLSRLLKGDWPKTLDELEQLKRG